MTQEEEEVLLFIKEWFIKHPSTAIVDDEDYEPYSDDVDIIRYLEDAFEDLEYVVEFESASVAFLDKKGLVVVSYPTNYEDHLAYEDVDLEDLLIIKEILTKLP